MNSSVEMSNPNKLALERMVKGEPVLVDISPAEKAIPELVDGLILHAGPPIAWRDMCGPMKAAVVGAIQYEGWAGDQEGALKLADQGEIRFKPNHDLGAVGPMTGITSPSMPMLVVENRVYGNRAFCTINEGLGKVLRFGANDSGVIERLLWIQSTLGPVLKNAVINAGGIELRPIMSRALGMGDEMHQRNVAATSLFLRHIASYLVRSGNKTQEMSDTLDFISANDQFFLNLGMAAAKSIMDPIADIPGSTIVLAMSRNGKDFGIRVSGSGNLWFTAPSLMPNGLYFPGFGSKDANPDIGDSAILEAMGLGGFAMAASPAVVGFVGAGSYSEAVNYTREMSEICQGRNQQLTIPALDFQGISSGIDITKVVESGITPVINTGIAHKEAGVGQIGAGIVRAPIDCFVRALEHIADSIKD